MASRGIFAALPPTLRRLELHHPPLHCSAALQLAGKLPLLQSFH